LGGLLSSFEVMWGDYYRAVTVPQGHPAPLDRKHPFYVVLEMQGPDQEADTERFNECLGMALEQGMITDAVVASSGAERNR
ncbi:FAD-linked oxidase C-terminal domain-containing protein, partial [Acinetobacter baumannii]